MEAIVVVDMQKDFCYKDGALYVPDAESIFKPIAEVIRAARGEIPVIFTQDWHREDDVEFKIWPKHCIMNSYGAEIVDELEPEEGDYYIKKRRYSAFFGTDLDLLLRELGVDKLYICGVVTNICVLHTAGDAVLRGYDVEVIKDGVKALSDYEQEYGLRHMENVFQAKLIESSQLIGKLKD